MARLPTLAVTGTNGKTTTTRMLGAIARAAAHRPAVVTTVGVAVDGEERGALPTAMSAFRAFVEGAQAEGADLLCLEVTSRALAGGFAKRWPPTHAALTSFSRDHLDRHGSLEAYLAAKAQLFLALPPGATAALPHGSEATELIAGVLPEGRRALTFGLEPGADLFGRVTIDRRGTHLRTEGLLALDLTLAMHGEAFAIDALAAATLAHAHGIGSPAIQAGLESFAGVPGRFEIVGEAPLTVVDFAHTPDALETTLATARALTDGKVWLVFGCGGERDQGKRAPMGRIASEGADHVVLTDDNPRGEDPAAIAAAVESGRTGDATWERIAERARAIAHAATHAADRDVVLIAGKGHEATQEEGTVHRPFDDRQVARRAVRRSATGLTDEPEGEGEPK